MNTIFINKGFIIASIIKIKEKYFEECFATFKEVNIITRELQQLCNKQVNTCIKDEVDNRYINIYNGIYTLSEDISSLELKDIYESYCPLEIAPIIFSENIIYEYILMIKTSQIETAMYKKSKQKDDCKLLKLTLD